jgi:hypothetical protein
MVEIFSDQLLHPCDRDPHMFISDSSVSCRVNLQQDECSLACQLRATFACDRATMAVELISVASRQPVLMGHLPERDRVTLV